MSEKIKVVFIGGLTDGKIVYDYLKANRYVELLLAITYKSDYTGARYIPLPEDQIVVRSGTVKGYDDYIKKLSPDLIVVTGWSELVPSILLSVPPMGCIGFHPARLPYDRGRSVLAWQIEEGYEKTALTMFQYTNYPDGGDILAQEAIAIRHDDYINDILDKVDEATYNMMRAYFPLLRMGKLKAKKQDLSEGSFRRLSGERDSMIHWDKDTEDIYNKIRAISRPYPGAFTELDGKRILVWKAEECQSFIFGDYEKPGTLVARLYDNSLIFKTRNGFIRITDWEPFEKK